MIDGKYEGKPLHRFCINGYCYYVIRGPKLIAALHGKTVVVRAPNDLSYHQAAIEADRARREGKFIPENRLPIRKEL